MICLIKNLISIVFTRLSLRGVKHGKNVHCNFYCRFAAPTIIGDDCHFNGFSVYGNGELIIGNHFHSGKRVRVLTSYHDYNDDNLLPYGNKYIDKSIVIEDNVWVGQDVTILAGVTIGEGAIIQAGSVVCKDIPSLAIAGGHPAEPFMYRDKEKYFKLKSKQ